MSSNSMDSTSSNPTSSRVRAAEQEIPDLPARNSSSTNPPSGQDANAVKKLFEIFGKFLECLIAIIAAMNSDKVKSLLKTKQRRTMALVFMIVVYFLTTLVLFILQHRFRNFLPILITLVLGSVASSLALSIISSTVAWITFPLWLCVTGLFAYCNRGEFSQMISAALPERYKKLIQTENLQSPPSPPV